MIYKEQEFVGHRSGGWDIHKNNELADSMFGETAFCFLNNVLLLCLICLKMERPKGPAGSQEPFYQRANSTYEGRTFMTQVLSKGPAS